MIELFRKGLYLGLGALSITRDKAEQAVEELVKKGEITADEAKGLADQLVKKGEEQRVQLAETVKKEVEKVRSQLDYVTREDYRQLEQRIKALEERIEE